MTEQVRTVRGTAGTWHRAPGARPRAQGESTLVFRGTVGSLVWGYHTAATFRRWAIYKVKGDWMLTARIDTINYFQARQAPLLFTAPRPGGFYSWSVSAMDIGPQTLRAKLGPPER